MAKHSFLLMAMTSEWDIVETVEDIQRPNINPKKTEMIELSRLDNRNDNLQVGNDN